MKDFRHQHKRPKKNTLIVGRVAIIKASKGFHEKLKEFEAVEPAEELNENEFLDKADQVFTM